MKWVKKLIPGQDGTKQSHKKFGDKLLCVRYRYDYERNECLKTAEIIVSKKQWNKKREVLPPNKIVHVQVKYGEIHI